MEHRGHVDSIKRRGRCLILSWTAAGRQSPRLVEAPAINGIFSTGCRGDNVSLACINIGGSIRAIAVRRFELGRLAALHGGSYVM